MTTVVRYQHPQSLDVTEEPRGIARAVGKAFKISNALVNWVQVGMRPMPKAPDPKCVSLYSLFGSCNTSIGAAVSPDLIDVTLSVGTRVTLTMKFHLLGRLKVGDTNPRMLVIGITFTQKGDVEHVEISNYHKSDAGKLTLAKSSKRRRDEKRKRR